MQDLDLFSAALLRAPAQPTFVTVSDGKTEFIGLLLDQTHTNGVLTSIALLGLRSRPGARPVRIPVTEFTRAVVQRKGEATVTFS